MYKMFLRFIHVVAFVSIAFPFMTENIICTYYILLINLLMDTWVVVNTIQVGYCE